MKALYLKPAAEADVREAASYLELRRPGYGEAFLAALDNAFALARQYPLAFPVALDQMRQVLPKRFPYRIFYVVEEGRISVY